MAFIVPLTTTVSKGNKNFTIDSGKALKLALMSIMMFSILLFHNAIRILKDSIIIQDFGAEAISFIKLWLEIPFVTGFLFLYHWLYNRFSVERIFRIVISSYVIFYLLFAFVIYPNSAYYHIDNSTVTTMTAALPNFKWFVVIFGNWSITLFYLFGETWPTIAFSLLFWQLANKVTTLEESKTIYPYFNFLGQVNLLVAGYIVQNISKSFIVHFFVSGTSTQAISLQSIIVFVSFLGFFILFSHYLLEKLVLRKQLISLTKASLPVNKIGVFESIKLVINNKTLILISVSIISYHVCVNLIEGIWLTKVFEFYSSSENFIVYQGKVLFYTGVCGIAFALLSRYLLKYFKWVISAIITPYIVLILGAAFFIAVLLVSSFELHNESYYLYLIILLGLTQNVLIKGSKYGIYDSVKEMQYIPLDEDIKSRGKASVDVIATNIGKSLGSLCQFMVFFIFPSMSINDIVVPLFVFFLFSAFAWISATRKLSKMIDLHETQKT